MMTSAAELAREMSAESMVRDFVIESKLTAVAILLTRRPVLISFILNELKE